MIPIKINNKKFKIKTISELTAKEFIEFSIIVDECLSLNLPEDQKQLQITIKYIAWQTKESFDNAFFATSSETVEKAIGTIPDVRKLPLPKWINKSNIIDTVGQRHQIESSKLNGYELLVFTLAVANAKSVNIDDVHNLRDEYYEMPFAEILSAGFFFFKNYRNGKRNARTLLKWLLDLIKILSLRNRQE